jgi:UBX domain-containing protein 6
MKKFFKGLALDVKFSRAGEGHRLDASESSKEKQKTSSKPSSTPSQPPSRPSEASMVAGAMTVERIEKQHQQQHASSRTKTAVSNTGKPPNTSRNSPPNSSTKKTPEETNVTRPSTTSSRAAGEAALARLERQQSKEEEKKRSHVKRHSVPESSKSQPPPGGSSPRTQSQRVEANPINVSVHLVCPNCERIELYSEMDRHLENCLQEVYLKDPVYGSVLLIHTLCKNQEKRTTCIDTLCKYLENILEHPDEEKYRKIRISNKAFQDRVAAVKGALLFVEAIGFKQSLLPHGDGEEQFYVLSEVDCPDVSSLGAFKELLREAQPVKPTLDRGLKVRAYLANSIILGLLCFCSYRSSSIV